MLRDLLFADDAALVAHCEKELQALLDRFSSACAAFKLIISLKKTKVMHSGTETAPKLTIHDFTLEVVSQFTYLGSTTSANGSLDAELGKRIGKAATTMTMLSSHVWENKKLTIQTKTAVYCACVLSTLLYGSESWTTYAGQEKRLHTFHMRCLRCILSIHWTDKVTNNIVLERAGVPTIFTLLQQRRLRWLGHVRRMSDGRIPKDLLYGELDHGLRPVGRPKLRFKDTCKRDMIEIGLDVENWETLAADCGRWRINCSACLDEGELRIRKEAMARQERRGEKKSGSECSTSFGFRVFWMQSCLQFTNWAF